MSHPVLTALGLQAVESGTYLGNGEWSKTHDAGVLEPVNPTDGEVLGQHNGLIGFTVAAPFSKEDGEVVIDADGKRVGA